MYLGSTPSVQGSAVQSVKSAHTGSIDVRINIVNSKISLFSLIMCWAVPGTLNVYHRCGSLGFSLFKESEIFIWKNSLFNSFQKAMAQEGTVLMKQVGRQQSACVCVATFVMFPC